MIVITPLLTLTLSPSLPSLILAVYTTRSLGLPRGRERARAAQGCRGSIAGGAAVGAQGICDAAIPARANAVNVKPDVVCSVAAAEPRIERGDVGLGADVEPHPGRGALGLVAAELA